MVMKILIAVDGKPHSQITLRLGAKVVQLTGSPATILTVARSKFTHKECSAYLARADEYFSKQDLDVNTDVRTGNPAKEILEEIKTGQYDLVILGSRRVSEQIKRLFGSTLDQVLEKSPCPLLIGKEDVGDLMRILICDSGAGSPPLMERFISQLRGLVKKETQVTVLHVMSQMSAGPGVKGWQLRAEAEELIDAHTPEGELLEHDIDELESFDIHPDVIVRHGWVVEEIIDEAKQGDYGLIVIGAHRSEGWQRYLLDDLAHQIIVAADRPVLVVK